MPLINQPAMGARGTVAKEAPANHNSDNRGMPVNGLAPFTVNGHRPTLDTNATLPGIDDGSVADLRSIYASKGKAVQDLKASLPGMDNGSRDDVDHDDAGDTSEV